MSTRTVRVRPVVVDDLPWIAELVRSSFDPDLLPYLVAAQAGIVRWWQTVLEHPGSFPVTRFLMAVDAAGEPLGYAELKTLDHHTGFLSYVAVAEAARGRRVAEQILAAYLREQPGVDVMELDVFASNVAARRLYDRLGFEGVASSTWWGAPMAESPVDDEVAIGDLHAVLARHRTYGFTDFVIDSPAKPRFGVLGDEVLRCFTPESFIDTHGHAVARGLFPRLSRLFAVLPSTQPLPDATALVQSLRLRSRRVGDLRKDA